MNTTNFEPGIIKKLDPVVVNRIAAGEIIQRPANALKEMIENSLDAKSTNIQISVKCGGLKTLQIQDNGTGIRKDDLEILCERFTTSKLKTFDDLQSISTYGFRGEALSSISHVAHLSIQTKAVGEPCAYKATYEDGKMKGPAKTCAGNQGTIITIEDIFYNVPQRKQVFKSPTEEYHRIMDVVSKYAVHNSHVGFTLRKIGENGIVLRTPNNSTKYENIRIVYGKDVANELMPIEVNNEQLQFKMNTLVTGVNYSSKKSTILLFINHRLVESAGIKNVIDQVFSTFLPKGNHPFVYMSIDLIPNNVDVNVHPTKHEVHFLHEDEIIDKIRIAMEEKLFGSNDTRELYTQQLLPGASDPLTNTSINSNLNETTTRIYAKDIIRSDAKEQKLEKFFGKTILISSKPSTSSQESNNSPNENISILNPITSTQMITKARKVNRRETKLTSILTLRHRIEEKCHRQLRKILAESIYVGCVNREKILIQFESNLYLLDVKQLTEELFYQIQMYDFENFNSIELENPIKIIDLAEIALKSKESGWCENDGPIDELAASVCEILTSKAPILKEYYGLKISIDGYLQALPILLDKHIPSMAHLPMYILRLATEVDWQSEKRCFDTFSRETAKYYSQISFTIPENDFKWHIEHVIYDNIKNYLLPQKHFALNILQIANLQNLYKVFERC